MLTHARGRRGERGRGRRGLLYRHVARCYWRRRWIVLRYLDFVWLWLDFAKILACTGGCPRELNSSQFLSHVGLVL